MAERSMTKALARSRPESLCPPSSKQEELASKKRALASPEVGAFIKEGAGASQPERPVAEASTRGAPGAAQLNAKIPADLYQRARRAVFENQMSKLQPSTLQDLVSQALSAELRRLGY